MLYAIIENDVIVSYGNAKTLWPDVSFPRNSSINEAWLTNNNAKKIRNDLLFDSETQKLSPTTPYIAESGEVYNVIAVDIPPSPKWQEFRASLRGIPELQALVKNMSTIDPIAHLALGVGLGQAAQGDTQTFVNTWSELLASGLIPSELSLAVQNLAQSFDLPLEFVSHLHND